MIAYDRTIPSFQTENQQPGAQANARPQRRPGRAPRSDSVRHGAVGKETVEDRHAAPRQELHPDAAELRGGNEEAPGRRVPLSRTQGGNRVPTRGPNRGSPRPGGSRALRSSSASSWRPFALLRLLSASAAASDAACDVSAAVPRLRGRSALHAQRPVSPALHAESLLVPGVHAAPPPRAVPSFRRRSSRRRRQFRRSCDGGAAVARPRTERALHLQKHFVMRGTMTAPCTFHPSLVASMNR